MSIYVIVRLGLFVMILGVICIVNRKKITKSQVKIALLVASILLSFVVINVAVEGYYWNILPIISLLALSRNVETKDKRIFRKTLIRISIILAVLIMLPFENAIISFENADDAFYYRKTSAYSHKINGNDSVLFITNTIQNERYLSVKTEYTILNKKNSKWLIDNKIPNRYKVKFYEDFSIIILQNVFSKEKFILITNDLAQNSENIEIVCENSTNVMRIEDDYGESKEEIYCIIINDSDEFSFYINEEKIIINN